MTGSLVEVFSSIQGEGPCVGVRQVFIRLAGCNLRCSYCDTAYSGSEKFRVEQTPGTGDFMYYPNPVEADQLLSVIEPMNLPGHHSISLTGGEPLAQPEFVRELSERLKKMGAAVYLETNGTLPSRLAELIPFVDIISMDIKLPSISGCGDLWETHREFIRVGARKDIFVKVVVAEDTPAQELEKTCQIIREVDRKIPLVIQPVTPHQGFAGKSPSAVAIIRLQDLALGFLTDVRVIPQTHRITGQL